MNQNGPGCNQCKYSYSAIEITADNYLCIDSDVSFFVKQNVTQNNSYIQNCIAYGNIQ
jgi:hypothetical protein